MEIERSKWSAITEPRPVLFSKEMQRGILQETCAPGETVLWIPAPVTAI